MKNYQLLIKCQVLQLHNVELYLSASHKTSSVECLTREDRHAELVSASRKYDEMLKQEILKQVQHDRTVLMLKLYETYRVQHGITALIPNNWTDNPYSYYKQKKYNRS